MRCCYKGHPTQAKTGLESGTVDCGLAEEKVNVLGHHDVCVDAKVEVAAHALKGVLKDSSACVGREQGTALKQEKVTKWLCPVW